MDVDPVLSTYRARLRFRVQKKLDIDSTEHRFDIAGRNVVLSSALPDTPIRDSEWLIMNARGFASEDDARQFGHRLRSAVQLSSVATRLGVDAGRDLATSGLGNAPHPKDFYRHVPCSVVMGAPPKVTLSQQLIMIAAHMLLAL